MLIAGSLVATLVGAALVEIISISREGPGPVAPSSSLPGPSGIGPEELGEFVTALPPEKIAAIDEPRFRAPEQVDELASREPVLAVRVDDDARAYPLRYLLFHEIVNDVVGGRPLVVTYCPLCNSGIAFERPIVGGRPLEFGVSGQLLNANLVMIDGRTGSLWSQALGEAIDGELAGTELTFVPAQILSWTQWHEANPDGLVLGSPGLPSRTKIASTPYGANPYPGHDRTGTLPAVAGGLDPRLPPTARVLGIVREDDAVAIAYRELRRRAVGGHAAVRLRIGEEPVMVLWATGTTSAVDAPKLSASRDVGASAAFEPVVAGRMLTIVADADGFKDRETGSRWNLLGDAVAGPLEGERLTPVVAVDHFWFDWVAFYPDTRLRSGR
jgi:hypothetical protein